MSHADIEGVVAHMATVIGVSAQGVIFVIIKSHDGASICDGRHDGTLGTAIFDGGITNGLSHDAAEIIEVADSVFFGDCNRAGAIAHGAGASNSSHDSAETKGIVLHRVKCDVCLYIAICDSASLIVAHNATNISVSSDAGISEGDTAYFRTAAYPTKEALTAIDGTITSPINADAADGVAVA